MIHILTGTHCFICKSERNTEVREKAALVNHTNIVLAFCWFNFVFVRQGSLLFLFSELTASCHISVQNKRTGFVSEVSEGDLYLHDLIQLQLEKPRTSSNHVFVDIQVLCQKVSSLQGKE